MSGGSNECLQAENTGGAHNLLEQEKRLNLVDTMYKLIYPTKWSVHSKFN